MSVLNKFNKGRIFNYDSNVEREFINFRDLYVKSGDNTVHNLQAIFINTKSRYGNAPVFISDEYQVNVPQHMLETSEKMMNDSEVVDLINEGKVGFVLYAYKGKNGDGVSCSFVEK